MEGSKYTFVRRANEKDYELRKSRINKGNLKTDFSQLQLKSFEVIEKHNQYYHDRLNSYLSLAKERHDKKISDYKKNLELFKEKLNAIKSGVKPSLKCNCKGDLKYIDLGPFDMIGCDNYRDNNFEHFKMYKPNFYGEEDFDIDFYIDHFEVSKNYLSDIVKELSFKVKASDLFEFLKLNNVKLHREDITREYFTTGKNSRELSDKRESIIYGQLQKRYKKIEKHVLIAYQLKSENFIRFAIPDMIAFDNKDIIIFEQKKTIDNINLTQTDLYVDLIKEMVDESYNVLVKFIIEEDYEYIPDFINDNEILTLKMI